MPNGAAFVYNENTELTTARGVAGNGSYASPISSASEKSIAPSDGSVKYSLRENDRKYMDAVEQGDTAEAERMVSEMAEKTMEDSQVRIGEDGNIDPYLGKLKKDAGARQQEKDAAKLDNALLATQMYEGRKWTAKLRNAEDRVAKAN